MEQALTWLIIVLAIATLAPLIVTALAPFLRVPVVVIEMLLGLIIGPGLLGWVHPDPFLSLLASFGMALLFFVAGYDTDLTQFRGNIMRTGVLAWLVCLALAILAGTLIASLMNMQVSTSHLVSGIFIGASIVSTALGTILPMMKDADEVDTKVGRAVMSSGMVGQFLPLVAIAVLVGQFTAPMALLAHIGFFAVVALLYLAVRNGLPALAERTANKTLNAGGQFVTRLTLLMCFALVFLGLRLGVSAVISSFAAGALIRELLRQSPDIIEADRVLLNRKFQSLAFGFLIPVFFINAGVTFDLPGLLAQPQAFALIPIFLLLFFAVRGLPGSLTLPRGTGWNERIATALLVGTGLAAVIVMVDLALEADAISGPVAAALIGAAKITALIFPTIALNLARRARLDNDFVPAAPPRLPGTFDTDLPSPVVGHPQLLDFDDPREPLLRDARRASDRNTLNWTRPTAVVTGTYRSTARFEAVGLPPLVDYNDPCGIADV